MESFFSRYRKFLVLIALLLAQTVGLATQVHRPADPSHPDEAGVRLLRLWTLATVSPFERLSAGTGHNVRGLWANYVDLRHVRQQNADLLKELGELRLERVALTQDALEGQRLRGLLGFRQTYARTTVAAQVIGTSGSDASHLLVLDKGARDGLRPGMPVITPDGIVGKLRDVFPHTAQLLLLNDPTSGAGVILESTRIHAILRGTPQGRVEILNLTSDPHIKPGEKVLTSGGDRVFPRGLPVGVIESIVPDPEHLPFTAITLKPAANLAQLDEVLVVTGITADLGQDEASDPGNNAADVSAERLPGLHDGKDGEEAVPDNAATPDGMPPSDKSTSLVPRPKPAMHPDRYSPGAAPPAAELKPGSPRPAGTPPQ